tara:strand:- start:111464 stop:113755 length:2292 start_codon:yes stop_codon:yes gene_type:complete
LPNQKNKVSLQHTEKGLLKDQREGYLPKHQVLVSVEADNTANLYALKDEIGRGAQGSVHLAMNLTTQKPCAVKVLSKESLAFCENWQREVFFLKKLNRLHDVATFGSEHNFSYLFMDHYPGANLESILYQLNDDAKEHSRNRNTAKNHLTISRKLALSLAVIKSLLDLHNKNIIHRDIKPGNFVITDAKIISDMAKLVDLGSAACHISEDDCINDDIQSASTPDSKSRTESRLDKVDPSRFEKQGAKGYRAPEQILSTNLAAKETNEPYNFSADLWSLGVLISEIWSAENYQKKLKTFIYLLQIDAHENQEEFNRLLDTFTKNATQKEKIKLYILEQQNKLSQDGAYDPQLSPECVFFFLADILMSTESSNKMKTIDVGRPPLEGETTQQKASRVPRLIGLSNLNNDLSHDPDPVEGDTGKLIMDKVSSRDKILQKIKCLKGEIVNQITEMSQKLCKKSQADRLTNEELEQYYLDLLEKYIHLINLEASAHYSPRDKSTITQSERPKHNKRKGSAPQIDNLSPQATSGKQKFLYRFSFSKTKEKESARSSLGTSPQLSPSTILLEGTSHKLNSPRKIVQAVAEKFGAAKSRGSKCSSFGRQSNQAYVEQQYENHSPQKSAKVSTPLLSLTSLNSAAPITEENSEPLLPRGRTMTFQASSIPRTMPITSSLSLIMKESNPEPQVPSSESVLLETSLLQCLHDNLDTLENELFHPDEQNRSKQKIKESKRICTQLLSLKLDTPPKGGADLTTQINSENPFKKQMI